MPSTEVTENRVVVFDGVGQPLRIVRQVLGPITSGRGRVRVQLAGICGSDAHRLAGHLPPQPVTVGFGHEAVGVIEELGAGFDHDFFGTSIAVGDRLFWSSLSSCGRCAACLAGAPVRCAAAVWPPPATEPHRAGYQDVATIDLSTVCVRVPEDASAHAVIALGCALPTAVGGMRRLGPLLPDAVVVIQGCGPVGLAFTLLAAQSHPGPIAVIGAGPERLAIARQLGATDAIDLDNTTPQQRLDRLRALSAGRGADVVIEAAGALEAFTEGMDLLAPGAKYLIAGLYSGSGTVPIDPVRINNLDLRLIGSLGFSADDVRAAVELSSHRRELGDLVTQTYQLSETEFGIRSSSSAIKAVVAPAS